MAHQFDPDFPFDMEGCISFSSQVMPCPSTPISFPSGSSSYDPFSPTSRVSTPHELSIIKLGGSYGSCSNSFEVVSPSTMGRFMMGPEFPDGPPNTPIERELVDFNYEDFKIAPNGPIGSPTLSNSSGLYDICPETVDDAASFVMTPSQMLSGSKAADIYSSWSYAGDGPFFSPQKHQFPNNYQVLGSSPQSVSTYHIYGSSSPKQMRARPRMMVNKIQRKKAEGHLETKKQPINFDADPLDLAWDAMCNCDYPGCHKAFRRKEHLKRHKQTFHGEGPNRFSCEFCGKGHFNRKDNLNNHRKLHARPNSSNRGVEFIAAAVFVIEQEKLNRKRRAPAQSKQVKKRGLEYKAGEL
ncbi:zinc finger odd-paired-like (opl) [Fusarium albosuccineum]|uniref:Zinc finger odd-paired-like (Opl) n=1 Tax=Fusarium albosuccineum TaxID=1237068 RepID=A0A8H4LAF6_9HYPO|nr:zinc finger odd-paired-like (opl) [Fusarium albosuccineum]